MENLTGYFILDALMNQYFLALGEFHLENFSDHPHAFLVYFFFVMATLFTQVTILNMIIAIMGDTFDKATDERENNARLTKLRIMGDYINLIVRDIDEESKMQKYYRNIK